MSEDQRSEDRRTITAESDTRLDQLLARTWDRLSRQDIDEMIRKGRVLINGSQALKLGQRIEAGDTLAVTLPEPEETEELRAPAVSLDVLYEDDYLLVVNKPAGIAMKRTRYIDPSGLVLPELLGNRYAGSAHVGGADRAGIVTRLDPAVSGLVVAARDGETYRELRRSIKRERMERVFSGLIEGYLEGEHTIDEPIGNVKHQRSRLRVSRTGRPAETYVRAQRHYRMGEDAFTLVYVRPDSSRLHQIRVHLSWYGFPLVGDYKYGARARNVLTTDRIFLHLSLVEFPHPRIEDEFVHVESVLPTELQSAIGFLRRPKYS
jgi:23S rRNA pseudouridine1911/1915/1917 synthase